MVTTRDHGLSRTTETVIGRGVTSAPASREISSGNLPLKGLSRWLRTPTSSQAAPAGDSSGLDPRLAAVKRILEALTGRRIHLAGTCLWKTSAQGTAPSSRSEVLQPVSQDTSSAGLQGTRIDTWTEHEQTAVTITGSIDTSEGTMAIDLSVFMHQASSWETRLDLQAAARLEDPLVINFGTLSARLSDSNFLFDINADGTMERVPWLAAGSGFLVLDRNGDGKATNGGELFGAATGNGFEELGQLDEDGNGWIDESDACFSRLSLWHGARPDTAVLEPLRAAGIGAISLAHADAEFSIRSSDGSLRAKVRSTGFYMEETGRAKSIQQVDLAV